MPTIVDWLREILFGKKKVKIRKKARKGKRKVRLKAAKRKLKRRYRLVRVRRRRKPTKHKIRRIAKRYRVSPKSLHGIYNKLSKIESKIPTRPTEISEVEKLRERIRELEKTAERGNINIVPEVMDFITETKERLHELALMSQEEVDPVAEIEGKIEELKKEKKQIAEAKDIVMKKYYKREIDETSLKKIMDEYEKRIIEIDVKIKHLKIELKKFRQKKVKEKIVKGPAPKIPKPIKLKKAERGRVKVMKQVVPKITKPFTMLRPVEIPHEKEKIIPVEKMPTEILKEVIVADIMTKNPVVVRVSDPLSYVVRLFSEKRISGAPVVRDDNFVGIVSESDIVKVIGIKDLLSVDSLGLKRLGEIKVSEVMHRDPIFVYEYTKLSDAADLMNKHDITRLPVLNEKREIVGIVARSDIIRGVSKELLLRILKKRPEEERIRLKVETDIDEVLKIVERKGSINVDEIQQKLLIPEEKIEEWGKILERHDLVEVFYPPIGKPELRKKLK